MKLGTKPDCVGCREAVCDECDDRSPNCNLNELTPIPVGSTSSWQKGFDDGKANRPARTTNSQSRYFPGYANGYRAGAASRAEELLAIKDHSIARAVNELTEIARQYHGTQQLRERISRVVVDLWHGRTQGSTTTGTK